MEHGGAHLPGFEEGEKSANEGSGSGLGDGEDILNFEWEEAAGGGVDPAQNCQLIRRMAG
jgi:hypothetical protein